MTLFVKPIFFSIKHRFIIIDEAGDPFWYVGPGMWVTDGLHIYDFDDKQVAVIRYLPSETHGFYRTTYGRSVDLMDGRGFSLYKTVAPYTRIEYRVEGIPWRMSCDYICLEFSIYDYLTRDRIYIKKDRVTWGNRGSFTIELAEAENALLCVCAAIAINGMDRGGRSSD